MYNHLSKPRSESEKNLVTSNPKTKSESAIIPLEGVSETALITAALPRGEMTTQKLTCVCERAALRCCVVHNMLCLNVLAFPSFVHSQHTLVKSACTHPVTEGV